MKKNFIFKSMMMVALMCMPFTFSSCNDEEKIHESEYKCKFTRVGTFEASTAVGNLKPDKTYGNQVLEGINQIMEKYYLEKKVTYSGNDYAAYDAEVLALMESAVAEMQAWQEEMHALKYEKDHKGSKFIWDYQYIVERDGEVLKESDKITFSYSRGALNNAHEKFEDNIYYFACEKDMLYDMKLDATLDNRIYFDLTNGVEAVGIEGKDLDLKNQKIYIYNPSNKFVESGAGFAIGLSKWPDGVARPTLEILLVSDLMNEGNFEYGQWYAWVKGMHNGLPFAFMVPFNVVEQTSDFI